MQSSPNTSLESSRQGWHEPSSQHARHLSACDLIVETSWKFRTRTLEPAAGCLVSRVAIAVCALGIVLGLCQPTLASLGTQPKAIVPTNSLPPSAGAYELCPPEATVAFNGTMTYQGTHYGIEYTTNGAAWTEFTVPTVYGDTVSWFDNLESWSDPTTNASVKWYRLKAKARPGPFPTR